MKNLINLIKTREILFVFVAAVLLSFLIFGNGITGEFVFDDVFVVQNRGDLRDSGNFFNLFISPYHQNQPKTGLFRPFTMASYAVNHYVNDALGLSFTENEPAGFHVVNIIIHAFNSFLVFWLINFLFGNRFLSYSTFLLFLTHPIHTEAVTSIVGRAELLSFFFSIASVYFFIHKNKTLSAVSFLLALLSKESALMTLPIIFYISVVLLNKRALVSVKNLFFFSLPLGLYSLLRYKALGGYFFEDITITMVQNPLKFSSFSERIFTAFKVLYIYVEKLMWPVHLSADYSFNAVKIISSPFASIQPMTGIFIFVLLIASVVFYKKFGKEISFSAALFLFPFLMISNLIKPVGTIMGERLIYFSSLGFAAVTAFVLVKIYDYKRWGAKTAYGLLIAILVFYGARTIIRNRDWQNPKVLFSAAVKEFPDSLVVRTALAGAYIRADEWSKAKEELEIARNIYENNSHLQNLLGVIASHEGNYGLAEEKYKKSIELNPDAINSYINLGELYLKQSRLEEARENFLKVINFYATIEYVIRYSYIQIALNKPDEALDTIKKYFGSNLDHPDKSAVAGTAYFVKGDYRQALVYLKNAREFGNNALEVEEMIKISEEKI